MKALTLAPSLAWAVAVGQQVIIHRASGAPVYLVGHDFAVHAGAEEPSLVAVAMLRGKVTAAVSVPAPADFVRCAVVAVASLRAITYPGLPPLVADPHDRVVAAVLRAANDVGAEGWGLVVGNVRPLVDPVSCRGGVGFWALAGRIDAEVTAQVRSLTSEQRRVALERLGVVDPLHELWKTA